MANKLREIFYPSEETIRKHEELLAKLRGESVEKKYCTSCEFYSYDPYVPGFVEYQGDCALNHVAYFGDRPDGTCGDWKEAEG